MFADLAKEPADVTRFQPIPPGFRRLGLRTPEDLRDSGQVLIGVEQIDDMHGLGEMGLDNGVVITRPVGQHDHGLGLLQTPAQSLGIDAPAEESAGFNSPDIGGGMGIALRMALAVQADLGEHTTQLGFPGAG